MPVGCRGRLWVVDEESGCIYGLIINLILMQHVLCAGYHQHLQAAAGREEQAPRGAGDPVLHHFRSSQYLDLTNSVPANI